MTQHAANTPDNQWGSSSGNPALTSLATVLGEPALLSRAALDALEQPLVVVDKQGTLRATNLAWRRFRRELGHPTDALIGRSFAETCLQDVDANKGANREDASSLYAGLVAILSNRLARCSLELTYSGRTFAVTLTPLPNAAGAVIAYFEITERKNYEARIEHLANHDPLTGLFNRRFFTLEAEKTLALARREEGGFALLYLDLDRFKGVNDGFGHLFGDALLCEVAKRLKACTRESDLLARLSGDEFVVLLQHVSPHDMQRAVTRYQACFARSFSVQGEEVRLAGSFGVAHYPGDGTTLVDLLGQADRRMYRVKKAGGPSRTAEGSDQLAMRPPGDA